MAGGDVGVEEDINVVDTSYTLTELARFQVYLFRVVAYNANGPGVSSDEVSCKTYSDGNTDCTTLMVTLIILL